MNNGISVIIPVFNEQDAIRRTVDEVCEAFSNVENMPDYEIIIVNDGSEDGTEDIIREINNTNVKIVTHETNLGYGAALKSGIKHARYQYVATTDADSTYPNSYFPELIKEAQSYDMVVGARTGSKVNIPPIRRPAKWAITRLARYLAGVKIPDLNSGMRIIKKDAVNKYLNILPNGFSFTTTITLALHCNNYDICYVPINYHDRKGKSKIKPMRDTLNFIILVIRTVMYFNPLKVFVPVSLILLLASIAALAYRVIAGGGLAAVSVILFVSAIQVLTTGMLADLVHKRSSI